MDELAADLHVRGQFGQGIGIEGKVSGLLRVETPVGQQFAVRDAQVKQAQRGQQPAGQSGGQLHGIRRQQVAPDLVMDGAQGIGACFAVGLRGQGPAQDGLAHALFTARHQLAGDVLGGGRGRLEDDLHARRDDARRILPQAAQGVQQRAFVLRRGAGRVFAQAQGQAVDLGVGDIGIQGIGPDQVGPGHGTEQARARQPAALAFVGVDQPAAGPQLRALGAAVAQAQAVAVRPQALEPGLRAEGQGLRDMPAVHHAPFQLQRREAMPDGIGHVQKHVLHAGHHVHHGTDLFRHLACPRVIAAGDDVPFQGQQRPLAFAYLAGQVLAAVLHVGKKRVLLHDIALFGVGQDAAQLARRQAVGQVGQLFQIQQGRGVAAFGLYGPAQGLRGGTRVARRAFGFVSHGVISIHFLTGHRA